MNLNNHLIPARERVQERSGGHLSVTISSKRRYIVLNVSDIKHRQSEQLSYVSFLFSVTKYEASVLLRHYKWNTTRLVDQWVHNEESVRNETGLFVVKSKISKENDVINCGICLEENLSVDEVMSATCDNHYYCKTCWRNYISTSINNNGPGCLSLRCPDPNCPAVVGQSIIRLVSRDDKQKYRNYLMRSYVEDKECLRWCPGQGCDRAIEFEHSGGTGGYDVECDCSHCFCWNCSEEPHRPVECKVVAKWVGKMRLEKEDFLCTNWIRTYTKPCPKCKRPIEKVSGCDNMICGVPCRHRFCWLCLNELRPDYRHTCNKNNAGKPKAEETQTNLTNQYYNKGWTQNNVLLQNAKRHLKISQNIKLPEPIRTQLEFVVEFWKLNVECRQVLKWSFVYGSMLLEDEDKKRQLLRSLQRKLEVGLECHYRCPVNGLSEELFIKGGTREAEFIKFREEITSYTTYNYGILELLVKALENGLCEPEPQPQLQPQSAANTKTSPRAFSVKKRWFSNCLFG
ncbi:putative E3 ubiquitin-protein ligase ARI5 [Silene latifolia]|uniref:putative E3 ubiquitin-protein ligase ARI5 n=1 Tax=Silene latifolia TaxID=37657 RepID=UPI003D76B5C1